MASKRFHTSRPDGRSQAEVLLAHISNAPYLTVFTYDELASVLSEGTDHPLGQRDVQQVVNRAKSRLLRGHLRALRNVPGVGYKIAHPNEQSEMASGLERRSNRQMVRAEKLLTDIDYQALTSVERQLVTAHRVVVSTVRHAMSAVHKRQDRQEAMIRRIADAVGVSVDQPPDIDVTAAARE